MNILNEKQYRSICSACDCVLTSTDTSLERVAIPWLHVIREHPEFLSKYTELIEYNNNVLKTLFRTLYKVTRIVGGWLKQFSIAVVSDGKPWFVSSEYPENVDVLFISHLVNQAHIGQESDFYYGDCANKIVENNGSAVFALVNHIPASNIVDVQNKWSGSLVPRFILSGSLTFKSELKLFLRLFKEYLQLRKNASNEADEFQRKVLKRASYEALSGTTRNTLRIASQIKLLVEKIKPRKIIITYEGHAWERLVFASARAAKSDIECIGYQHAVLFRLQHSIRRNLSREYNPDKILTAGEISKRQLQSVPDLKSTPIIVLGSNKAYKNIGFDGFKSSNLESKPHEGKITCLVLPEGFVSECNVLFGFSLECAKELPEINFVWRLHPLITFDLIINQNSNFKNLPKNIILSKDTLEHDINESQWALYRGSTAIIEAVNSSLKVIYLEGNDDMMIDPLYELDGNRKKIKNIHEFLHVIEDDGNQFYVENELPLKEYCGKLFVPFDNEVILKLMK